jgi:nucleotide-binding universal stress UspA family protein
MLSMTPPAADREDSPMDEEPGDGPYLILVGVDGSDTSMRAGAYAAGLARRQGSRLVCLYVRGAHVLSAAGAEAVGYIEDAQDAVAAEIQQSIVANSARLGIDVTLQVREGNPFTEIVRLADERHPDAVVVGASMQAGHRIIGSLATHLVRSARWPVIVVP